MSKPNIIYIYADDLGRGMLSCYGQKHFQTPNIDRLAGEGIQFTRAYGCIFCAPARASLMTGYHDAHAGRWTFTKGGLYRHMAEGTATFEDIAELINNTSFQIPGNTHPDCGNQPGDESPENAAIQEGRTVKKRSLDGVRYDDITTRHTSELNGEESPDWKDGESFLPTLTGNDQQPHAPVICSSRLGPALTTADGWKLRHISKTDGFQLYNVLDDYREENDLAAEYPDKVNDLGRQLLMASDGNFAYGNPDMHRAYYVHNQQACQDIA